MSLLNRAVKNPPARVIAGTAVFLFLAATSLVVANRVSRVEEPFEPPAEAAPATGLFFAPAKISTFPAKEFILEAKMNTGANSVTAADVRITFDKNFLEAGEVLPGDFLPTKLIEPSIDNNAGRLSFVVGARVTEEGAFPARGEGSLARIKFKAKDSLGSTNIAYDPNTQVAASGESASVVLSSRPATVEVTVEKPPVSSPTPVVCAQVITPAVNLETGECREFPDSCLPEGWKPVSSCPTPTPSPAPIPTPPVEVLKTGDVNGDGKVNILDIGLIIEAYDSSPPSIAGTDLNADGKVSILDIGIVIENYEF